MSNQFRLMMQIIATKMLVRFRREAAKESLIAQSIRFETALELFLEPSNSEFLSQIVPAAVRAF